MLQTLGPDYLKGSAATVCLRIFGSKEKGNKFSRMIGMEMGEKEMSNLCNSFSRFQQSPHGTDTQIKQEQVVANPDEKGTGTPRKRRDTGAGAQYGDSDAHGISRNLVLK
jgi:membrane protease subunit (stomatin/prohibitin family)